MKHDIFDLPESLYEFAQIHDYHIVLLPVYCFLLDIP